MSKLNGTATMLGDSVELAAMKKAFDRSTQKKQFCAIGSVKPNMGHLDRASGVTGLIKTSLALKHKLLPPSLNFEHASAEIDLDNSPFYVNTQQRPGRRMAYRGERASVPLALVAPMPTSCWKRHLKSSLPAQPNPGNCCYYRLKPRRRLMQPR